MINNPLRTGVNIKPKRCVKSVHSATGVCRGGRQSSPHIPRAERIVIELIFLHRPAPLHAEPTHHGHKQAPNPEQTDKDGHNGVETLIMISWKLLLLKLGEILSCLLGICSVYNCPIWIRSEEGPIDYQGTDVNNAPQCLTIYHDDITDCKTNGALNFEMRIT